jgi:ferredoxin-NADP reductase
MANDQLRLIVDSKSAIANGIECVSLRCESSSATLPRWTPGSHIDLVLPGDIVRQYSLCGDPESRTAFRIAVLREPQSRGGSQYIHDTLAVGDSLIVRGPRNNFPFITGKRYRFIAGGIGITPILPMIVAAHAAGDDWQLLYGGRTRASMAFLSELEPYGDRVRIAPQDEIGLLDLSRWLEEPQSDCLIYCCGPESLLTAVETGCGQWPVDALRVERFKPRPNEVAPPNTTFELELRRSNVTLTVPPDKSILQTIEDAGISSLFSCLEGICGTCEARVIEGIPDHRDSILSDKERNENRAIMICVSRSRTRRLVLDL